MLLRRWPTVAARVRRSRYVASLRRAPVYAPAQRHYHAFDSQLIFHHIASPFSATTRHADGAAMPTLPLYFSYATIGVSMKYTRRLCAAMMFYGARCARRYVRRCAICRLLFRHTRLPLTATDVSTPPIYAPDARRHGAGEPFPAFSPFTRSCRIRCRCLMSPASPHYGNMLSRRHVACSHGVCLPVVASPPFFVAGLPVSIFCRAFVFIHDYATNRICRSRCQRRATIIAAATLLDSSALRPAARVDVALSVYTSARQRYFEFMVLRRRRHAFDITTFSRTARELMPLRATGMRHVAQHVTGVVIAIQARCRAMSATIRYCRLFDVADATTRCREAYAHVTGIERCRTMPDARCGAPRYE